MTALAFAGAATPLGATDIAEAAKTLGVDAAAISAVCDVESAGKGFLPDKRPAILFESHQFHRLTHGKFDASHPGISTPVWVHNYGLAGAHQYDRLAEAVALDRACALQSASWGRFQVMGLNFRLCGFADVESFVAAMTTGEKAHLDAFCAFCKGTGLVPYLQRHDWQSFARGYNGPGQVSTYATALANAYQRHARTA